MAGIPRTLPTGGLAYAASKAALNTMTKGMALELSASKIRVNSICPWLFKSELTQGLMEKDWLKNVVFKTVPLRTLGTTNPAMTSVLRYLIHDSSKYITGNIFIVDSGITLPGVPLFSSLYIPKVYIVGSGITLPSVLIFFSL